MIKVLFVCHGNICRSPMAEFIMKDLVNKKGIREHYYIESAATSTEEIGNDMYPPAKRILSNKGIPYARRQARQIEKRDYDAFDYIIGMDSYNMNNLHRRFPYDKDHKIYPLLDGRSVSDPWYTDDFDRAYKDILEGCTKWLEKLERERHD
ncbi:MAG: low molecular weight phosphotyrosine protein phosphatase [Holdemanella sp.]|nr:low molecular weight phosphotyrosine protein phosphatase [Holdemanella sp.]